MSNTQNAELFTSIDDSLASTVKGGSVSLLTEKVVAIIQEPSINDVLAQLTPQGLEDLIANTLKA